MAGERQTLLTAAAAAGAAAIAVAVSAVIIWNTAGKQRDQFIAQLAALNAKVETVSAKIDKANEAVAEVKKLTALESTTQAIDRLNAEIKKTNDGLAELRKSSPLDAVKSTLAQLDSKIEKTGAALAEIKTVTARAGDAQAAADATRDKAIAKLGGDVAELKTGVADMKTAVAGQASAQTQSLDAIGKTVAAIKTTTDAQQAAAKKTGDQAAVQAKDSAKEAANDTAKELVVVYVSTPAKTGAPDTTASVPVAPLSVRFEKIGSTDPGGQAQAIVGNLKKIMKDRRDCSISVAGYADTLGSDAVNLDISRERAEAVAAKLRTAFAGEKIPIKSVAWGERQLKVWTPDGKSEKANRRVDINVDCKT